MGSSETRCARKRISGGRVGAETYESLTQRVWAIAPEMAALNHLDIAPDRLRLCFAHEAPAPVRRAAS